MRSMKQVLAVLGALLLAGTAGCGPAGEGGSSSPASSQSTKLEHQWETVVPSVSAEEAAKRINNQSPSLHTVASETASLYTPVEGASYAHHPFLVSFKGKLYAMFSLGKEDEDDCGQHVMIASCEEFPNWSEPKPLVDVTRGQHSDVVMVPMGFYVYGETLVAYYRSFEYDEESLRENGTKRPLADSTYSIENNKMHALISTDGETWTPAPSYVNGGGGNYPPVATKSGRLLMAGATIQAYSDDLSGTGRWSMSVIPNGTAYERGAKLLTESSFFQTDDGIIHMMLRTNTDYLWCSESYDDGVTWTEPYPTNFTDCWAKFQFGQLPDGRFFYLGNPVPDSNRNPLVLSLSENGTDFTQWYLLQTEGYRQQFPGLYKQGVYGYPHGIVADGYLYVIYSKHKEAIDVMRISLSDLA